MGSGRRAGAAGGGAGVGDGAGSTTVQLAVAWAEPAGLRALTVNLCAPSARREYFADVEQTFQAAPSSRQVTDFAPVALKAIAADVEVVDDGGAEVIETLGGFFVVTTILTPRSRRSRERARPASTSAASTGARAARRGAPRRGRRRDAAARRRGPTSCGRT